MIVFACPGCQSTFKLADEMAGKTARCSKCNHRFTVPKTAPLPIPPPASAPARAAAPVRAPAPPPASPKKVPLQPVPEVIEAEVVEADIVEAEVVTRPAPPPLRGPKKPADVDEVEVVDDDAIQDSRRAKKPMPVRAADDDDDDDGRDRRRDDRRDDDRDDDDLDDRPRRRRGRRQGAGSGKMGTILACVGGGAFVMMIISYVGLIMTAVSEVRAFGNNPQQIKINFNPAPMQNPPPIDPNPMAPQPQNPAPAGGAQITLVNGNYETQDQLTANDPKDTVRALSRAKRYTVTLEQGRSYMIEMTSTNPKKGLGFDPYLRVEHNGVSISEDDDGAGFPNARIVLLAQQGGNYVIIATSLGPPTGAYRLTIRRL